MNRSSLRTFVPPCVLPATLLLLSLFAAGKCHALSHAYISNQGDNTVSVINTADNTITTPPLAVGQGPFGIAIAPVADFFYVVNRTDNSLSQVNVATAITATTFPTGPDPVGVAISPDSAYAYVTNHGGATLTAVHVTDNSSETITLSGTPYGIVASPAGNLLYVTDDSSNQLLVVDLTSKSVTASLTVGNQPKGVAANSTGQAVVVANYTDNTVSIISTLTNAVSAAIPVGQKPFGVAITPDDNFAYVTNTGDNSVSVISLATYTVSATIPVGLSPQGISVTPNGAYVYVVNNLDKTVSVIATADNTVKTVLPVGAGPIGLGRFIGGPAPLAPSNLVATLTSDTVISLSWTDNATDETGYRLERKKYVQGAFVTIATLGPNVTSYVDPGLDSNANYYYRVRAFNDDGVSGYSEISFATTAPEVAGCFIATAAYGSMMEPQVQLLRDFRDRFLTGNVLGRAFIRFYYENSPPLARYIAEHDTWRLVVRCCLLPVVLLAWLSLALAPEPVLLAVISLSLLGVGGLGVVYMKKRARRRGETA